MSLKITVQDFLCLLAVVLAPVGARELAGQSTKLQFGENGEDGGHRETGGAYYIREMASIEGEGVEDEFFFGIEVVGKKGG